MEFQPMSPEQVERTVQFLLQQHAETEANLASAGRTIDQAGEAILGLTKLVDRVDRRAEEVFGRVDALVASVGVIRDGLNALTGIVGRIEERADRRLDRFLEGIKTERTPPGRRRSSRTRRRP